MTSNDQTHPYLKTEFWLDSKNWHWTKWQSEELNQRMYKRIVLPCLKKLEKKGGTSNHFPKSQE